MPERHLPNSVGDSYHSVLGDERRHRTGGREDALTFVKILRHEEA